MSGTYMSITICIVNRSVYIVYTHNLLSDTI